MSLHVLYVINSLTASGGAEQSLAAMVSHLVRRGVTLDIAYLDGCPGLQGSVVAAGASTFLVEGNWPGQVTRMARLARARRPDLMHTTLWEADQVGRLAAVAARVPIVTSLVNASYGPEHLSDPQLRRWKVRATQAIDLGTSRTVRRFHAISEHVAHVMTARLLLPANRIDVIPRGRDPVLLGRRSQARRQRTRASLGVEDTKPIVLAAARQEHQKGLDVLVEAAAVLVREVPGLEVLIAGREGHLTPVLRATVARLGLAGSVRFLGARSDVADLLAAADVFVLPSRWEGLGGVLIEAMALEVPIVATDLPPVREVVGSGDGGVARLVPSQQPEALARAVLSSLDDPSASSRTSRGRARFLQSFAIDRTVEQMLEFYERALEGRTPVQPEA